MNRVANHLEQNTPPLVSAPAPKLTIFDLRDSPWVDGPGRTILEIADGLNRAGYRYIIGALVHDAAGPNDYIDEAKRRGLEAVPIIERASFDRAALAQVTDVLKRYRVDIVHTHEFRSDIIGLLCARRAGARLVATTHGWIANNLKGRLYTVLDKLILRRFDRVIVVSQKIKRQLRRWRVAEPKIEVVPNALMVDEYRPDRADHSFRRELGIDAADIVIANIGRLSPEKGQDLFLQAAAQVLPQWPQARFLLVGVGPDEAALRALAARLDIDRRVTFAGYRKNMKQLYNSTDLVVQSSHTEGMPNVVLEALLMQVPVIATDVGGTGEIIEHQRHGVLIAPGSADPLVASIGDFLRDRSRFETMARAGSERVRRDFDSRRRIERMEQIYRALIGARVS